MPSPWLQGIQVGANIASDAMNRNLRMQELRSQEAMRRVNERAAVQQMQIQMEERNRLIDYQAQMAKAVTTAQQLSSEFINIPTPTGAIPLPNPMRMSPEDAAFRTVLPVVAQFEPDKAPQFLQNIATAQARTQSAQALTAQRASSVAVNEARVNEINTRIQQLQKGKTGVDPEWVRTIQFMEQRRGQQFAPQEIEQMWQIHSGAKPRAGSQRPVQTEMEYVTQQLPSARRAERMELKNRYRSDAELIEELKVQYRNLAPQEMDMRPEMQPATQFRKGMRAIQNGVTYEFDGTKWNAIR